MEIGTMAEWATAVAETAAVLVALFLPYMERRRAAKKDSRNLKIMLRGIISRALEDNDARSLELFLTVSTFTDATERDGQTINTAHQILGLFNNKTMELQQRDKEINALLDTIHP